MSDIQQLPKPHPDVTDYEWERTPISVKILIEDLESRLKQRKKQIEELNATNQESRQKIARISKKLAKVASYSPAEVIMWTTIGLMLTIGGTFIQAYSINAPWNWIAQGIQLHPLGVTYQIGAVLLIGCLGGKTAAVFSQIAYIIFGLTYLPIFDRGGGLEYIGEPSFGYILGFILGALVCGFLAFKNKTQLKSLALSCLAGFSAIHLTGIVYILILGIFTRGDSHQISTLQAILNYSIYPLPGQLTIVCTATLVAFIMRKLMFI